MMQMITEGTMCCSQFIGRNSVNVLERNISILMLGLDNTGKTCTAKSLVGESLDLVAPTVGFSKESTKYKGFRVNIFDLGGSKRCVFVTKMKLSFSTFNLDIFRNQIFISFVYSRF